MPDPLTDIENRKAQIDIGAVAARIYQGSRSEGLSRRDSVRVLVGWFMAMLESNADVEESE